MSYKTSPAVGAVAITKSDSTVYTPALRAIYVGGVGIVKVRMANGDDNVQFTVPAGTLLPISVDKIYSADTTATLMVGLR